MFIIIVNLVVGFVSWQLNGINNVIVMVVVNLGVDFIKILNMILISYGSNIVGDSSLRIMFVFYIRKLLQFFYFDVCYLYYCVLLLIVIG